MEKVKVKTELLTQTNTPRPFKAPTTHALTVGGPGGGDGGGGKEALE